MAEFISIASFNTRPPAEKLAEQLREAGFASEVFDESHEQKWQLFQLDPHAHLRVRVPEPELQKATEQLHAWEGSDTTLAQAVHCPSCNSTRVEYPQFSRRTLIGALPAIAASAGLIEQNYFCESCNFTWRAEPAKPDVDRDALNWKK